MTLIEELEQAAKRADEMARTIRFLEQTNQGMAGLWQDHAAEAARLRKRVERIKEYRGEHPCADETCPYCVATRWLTGDL
jgi:hypothetical protein